MPAIFWSATKNFPPVANRNILYMNRAMQVLKEVEIFQLSKSFAFNDCFTGYNTAIGLHS